MTCPPANARMGGRLGRALPLAAAAAVAAFALSACAGPEVSARLDALRVDWEAAEAALTGTVRAGNDEPRGQGHVATGISLPVTASGTGTVWANHNLPREVPVPDVGEPTLHKPTAAFQPPVLLASAETEVAAALAETTPQAEAVEPVETAPVAEPPVSKPEASGGRQPPVRVESLVDALASRPEQGADAPRSPVQEAEGVVVLAQATAADAGAPNNANSAAANNGASAIVRHAAEARVPLGTEAICETPAGLRAMPDPHDYPDEYICDGGDRGYPVHFNAYNRLGLETSDAVAEFVDHTGKLQVRPTNRVCVYAPRFAAMRTLDTPAAQTSAQGVASADRSLRMGRVGNRMATDVSQQQTPAAGLRIRSRASGVDVPTAGGGYDQVAFSDEYARYRSGHQEISFLYTGRLKRAEEAWLASGVQAAAVWTRDQFPMITARTQGAEEVVHRFQAEEIIGTDGQGGQGELRIVKLADRTEARPGDVLTFTLRYDNLGDGPLSAIRIVDNLSPRLEYIEDSETSDRAGTLHLEDNQEGSLVLIFELDAPLPAKTGGVITFRARVR